MVKVLSLRAGGAAAGAWGHTRRRVRISQGRRGGTGGRALQQRWRQLRSYIHQQRGWRRRTGEAAGLEGERGEARGGVTLGAATPLARTGGGANGLGGSRASGWR